MATMDETKEEMKILNLETIRAWEGCNGFDKWIPKDWTGTALDLLCMHEIPSQVRLICAARKESGIDEHTLQLFALWCGQQARALTEPEAISAVKVTEDCAIGKATQQQVNDAWSIARKAIGEDAWLAARNSEIEQLISMVNNG